MCDNTNGLALQSRANVKAEDISMLHIGPIRLIFPTCYSAHSGLCVKPSFSDSSTVQPFQHGNKPEQEKQNKKRRQTHVEFQ